MADSPQYPRCLHYIDAVREEAGGVVRAVLDLTGALAAAGAPVTLLTADAQDVPAGWGEEPGTPRVQKIQRAMTPWFSLGAVDRAAAGDALAEAEVVHLHTPWDPFNLALAAEARRAGKPYLLSAHGMLDDWSMAQSRLKKRVYLAAGGRRMLNRAWAVHLTAEAERDQAMKWAPAGRGEVLPLVMDLAPYQSPPGPEIARQRFPSLQTGEPVLLFLSRVHPKKGIELLLESLARCTSRPRAVIAGPGEDDYVARLKGQAGVLGLGGRVDFVGMVRGEEKLSLYRACDAFVLPTQQENFGIVLTEAMACGLPTITTRGTDIWRELQERGAVIVDRDAARLAAEIDKLVQDPAAATERGERSRNAVLEWLDPTRVVEGYLDLYRRAAAGTSG